MTRTHRAAAVVVAVAATLLLTACNPAQAGSAALVGDVRISETRVNQAAADAMAAATADPSVSQDGLSTATLLRQNVSRLISSELLAIAAQQEGLTVTQAEIDAVIEQASNGVTQEAFEAQIAAQFGVPPAELDSFVHDFILHQKLGAKLDSSGDATAQGAAADARLVQIAQEEGVSVSPRYGHWNSESGSIDGDLNDLSATPTASPRPDRPATIG